MQNIFHFFAPRGLLQIFVHLFLLLVSPSSVVLMQLYSDPLAIGKNRGSKEVRKSGQAHSVGREPFGTRMVLVAANGRRMFNG